jgi:tight adherence protein B
MAAVAGALGVLAAWEALAAVDQRLAARALARWLGPLRAAREPSARERRRLGAVAAGALCASGWLVAGPVAAVVVAAAGPWAAGRALAVRRSRRRAELVAAAPAVARALADALGGGHSVRGAICAAAGAGFGGAAGAELRAAAGALDAGAVTDDVLDGLRRRAGDPGWDTLVAAILLQRDAGGDLALLLRGLAERLESARRADADARSATAQARFTAWLVAALPAAAAGLAEFGSPGYLASLAAAPLTLALLASSLALQAGAVLAIRRMTRPA